MATAVRNDKWVKRWEIPKSSGDGNWIVAIDKNGNYGCSCPVWKFHRQECHHIKQVKMGFGTEQARQNRPEYVLAKVNKPIFNSETNQLLCPLIGIPDACMMEATICFYLLKYGYSMGEIREMRHIPHEWTAKAIFAHIDHHGEAEYPPGWYEH
jgi:hypothetical protein